MSPTPAKLQKEDDKTTLVKTKPRVEATRVLVTGGAGFVGSHLCDFLVARGDYVRRILHDQCFLTRGLEIHEHETETLQPGHLPR